jgi:CRP-like cAMP-binding protein
VQTLEPLVKEVRLFEGMEEPHLEMVTGCAANVRFEADTFLGRLGEPADRFWVIRQGLVALEVHAPGRGAMVIGTAREGDVVGFSWLLPPHQFRFDVHVLDPTRALQFDGRCLRVKCSQDPRFGHALLSRFSQLMAERLDALSLQLVDLYGDPGDRRH